MSTSTLATPKIVTQDEWVAARKELLAEEKYLTRLRDQVNRRRRELPWFRVEKNYVFDSPRGKESLTDLFQGRSQLLIYHFMFAPGWKEGCVGCSFQSDHIDGALVHLENHDVSLVAVSRAPLAEIEAFKARMGWRFRWLSSHNTDFNFDYHVSFTPEQAASSKVYYNYDTCDFVSEELPGLSAFYKDEAGSVFHTYSAFARGVEMTCATYMYLDFAPKGRNEDGPRHNLTDWVRHHDRYGATGSVDHTGRYAATPSDASCKCAME